MFKPVSLFIGLRYMRGRAADGFGQFISWLSLLGITLGVMALVILLSVMNGFERELKNKILDLMPQVVISTADGFLDPQHIPATALKGLTGIKNIVPITTADVVLQSASHIATGVMLGITPEQPEPLADWLIDVYQQQLQPGRYAVIMGEKLANQLDVKVGDRVRLMAHAVSQLTPMGRMPSQRLFNLIGVFAADSEVDSYQLMVNQQDASRLLHYPSGAITGWRLLLKQPLTVDRLDHRLLPAGTTWVDWRERKGELFQAVRMERNIMILLLGLIIIVAAFNIMTSLGLLVMEKHAEVAILQTQGLTRRQVMVIFMVQGASAGVMGALLGVGLGILFSGQLNVILPLLGLLAGSVALPVVIEPLQVAVVAMLAMVIALLSTLYPSWRAAAVLPAEVLRYE